MAPLSLKIIEMLRSALTRVESQAGLTEDDPALLEFKRSVVRNVAELEIAETDTNSRSQAEGAPERKNPPSNNAA